MKALTLLPPWDWAILELPPTCWKDVENRTWAPFPALKGQRIILHTGKGWDEDGFDYLQALYQQGKIPSPPPTKAEYPRGVLKGEVTIVDWTRHENILNPSHWEFGPWCWQLADPLLYANPSPWQGAQLFWNVQDAVAECLRAGGNWIPTPEEPRAVVTRHQESPVLQESLFGEAS